MTAKKPPMGTTKRTSRLTAPSRREGPSNPLTEGILPQAFLELAPDAIIVADTSGHILLVNHQVEVLFGYARSLLLGRPVEMLLPSHLHAIHKQHRAQYMAAPHTRPMGTGLELFGHRQDGSAFPVEVSLSPLRRGDTEDDRLIIAIIRDVTERTRLEHEHKEQAERLVMQAALIDAAHDAILVRDPSSHIMAWNHGAEEIYGWTAAEAVGQVSHALFQTHFPTSPATVEATLAREGRWEGELEHTRSDGGVVQVESRQVVVRDAHGKATAILEINRDITARKRLEVAEHMAAEQRQTLLQTVLGELPGAAYLVRGPEATLVMANHAATKIWGATWPEGQPMAEFLRTSGVGYFAETGQPLALERLVTRQIVRGRAPALQQREVIRRADGTRVPILLSAVAFDAALLGDEGVRAWGSEWRDEHGEQAQATHAATSSARARLQAADPERAALVLVQDISMLQAAEQLKDEFIIVAAHELRTPLTAIQGFASMLDVQTRLGRGADLVDWQREAIDEIETAAKRLNNLVGDLLDATRIQAGRLELHLVPMELVAMVRRCLARLRLTTQHTLTLAVEGLASDEPVLLVEADDARLEQVLGNLLSNAIKYSPEGGPITVTVRADHEARLVEVRIRDQGIGIPADQQAQLFQRFARASNVHDHHITGTGLGLYVCRELVEHHGGHIWLESAEGEGATFSFTLPILPTLPTLSTIPLDAPHDVANGGSTTHHASQSLQEK
jgi:PAS domain S-box-containing protein